MCERDTMYRTTEVRFPAVVKLGTDDAAPPAPTTWGKLMETLDIVPGISLQPQGTSPHGSSHISLGIWTPLSNKGIVYLPPDAESDSSPIQKAEHVEPICFYPWISPPQILTLLKSDSEEVMVMSPALPEE